MTNEQIAEQLPVWIANLSGDDPAMRQRAVAAFIAHIREQEARLAEYWSEWGKEKMRRIAHAEELAEAEERLARAEALLMEWNCYVTRSSGLEARTGDFLAEKKT